MRAYRTQVQLGSVSTTSGRDESTGFEIRRPGPADNEPINGATLWRVEGTRCRM